MTVDPRVSFWLGIVTTVALLIGQGTLNLTNAIPDVWVPTVVAWTNIVGTVGTAVMTALAGVSSNGRGPVALKMGWH